MFNTKEEFLECYEENFKKYISGTKNQLDTYNELMSIITLGYLRLGHKIMAELKEQMEEIRERNLKWNNTERLN